MASTADSPIAPTVILTPDQVAFFHENGFLAIDAITTPEEIARMKVAYDRIFAERAGREKGDQFDLAGTDEEGAQQTLPQILNPAQYAPELRDTLYRANARAIAQQLLGTQAKEMGDHAIFKPARTGAATPWHQDEAYWAPDFDYTSFSTWMPLQPATLENGCMQFIPGSHRLEVLPHHSINFNPRIHGLEVDPEVVDLSKAVACPLPPGGCTFHLSRTLHYTGPNRSDIPRRAFTIVLGLPPRPRAEPRTFPWNEIKAAARQQRAGAMAGSAPPPGEA